MPIYEYECAPCKKVHEVTQKITDAPLAACPDCGAAVKKLISRSSFALSGSGYYSTDYKKSSASTSAPTCPTTSAPCAKPECAS